MEFDPQLSILQSGISAIPDERVQNGLERSRFNLFKALANRNPNSQQDNRIAMEWAEALQAALRVARIRYPGEDMQALITMMFEALAVINEGLKN